MGFGFINSFISSKYVVITTAVLLIVPYCNWRSLFTTYRTLRQQYKEKELFMERHNCIVTYQPDKGIRGWPPNTRRHQPLLNKESSIDELFEPFLYFISTAEKSLDIAVMIINIKKLYVELVKARRRGVAVRLFLNYQHSGSSLKELNMLKSEGAKIQFFISPNTDLGAIMHYKYIVKDERYLCMGSMNLTVSSFLNNYESMVFLSNPYVVQNFARNFSECWDYVKIDNEGLINKTVLHGSHFL